MNSSLHERLDELFAAFDRADSPGCALAVYREGEIVYRRGYGMAHLEHGSPITPATVFHIASISKQFTAMAIALLARSGGVSLADDIRRHVPELPAGPPLTLRHILHHTSGLRDQWDLLRLAGWRPADLKTTGDIVRLATRQQALNFPTGTRFQYINTGYTLLAVAVERVTGRSLRRYAEDEIFRPLGMASTFFHDDHRQIVPRRAQAYSLDPAGRLVIDMPDYETVGPTGLLSTVEDFARWERNFLAPTVGDEELIRQVCTPGLLDDGRPTNYALGLVRGSYAGLPVLEHAGGDAGYRAHFLRFPEERAAIAVFANFGAVQPAKLARQVADLVLAERFATAVTSAPTAASAPTAVSAKSAPGDAAGETDTLGWAGRALGLEAGPAAELESIAGDYQEVAGGIGCRVEHRGGRLFLIAPGEIEYELGPLGERRFRFLGSDVDCVFQPVPDEATPTPRAGSGGEAAGPSAAPSGGWRMVVFHGGAETAVCERVSSEAKAAAGEGGGAGRPEDYAGLYWSEELEALYAVAERGGDLTLERPKSAPALLRPETRDQFSDGEGKLHLRFSRGESGRIEGFSVSAERVWNIRFLRDGA